MRSVLKIIDFYLNQLMNSTPSPSQKIILDNLLSELKSLNYPKVELVDIISISIILNYLLSDYKLIKMYSQLIKNSFEVIGDILSDALYVKIEPKIISIENEFYTNICPDRRQFEHKLTEEIRDLIIE